MTVQTDAPIPLWRAANRLVVARVAALALLACAAVALPASGAPASVDGFAAAFSLFPAAVWALVFGAWAWLAATPQPGRPDQWWREIGVWGGALSTLSVALIPYVLIVDDMTGGARSPIAWLFVGGLGVLLCALAGWLVSQGRRRASATDVGQSR